MTIRAGKKRRQSQQQAAVTIAHSGGSQIGTPRESDTATTVPNGSQDEQQATTVLPAQVPTSGRVRVGMQIAATIQRIERDLIELKRQLRAIEWDKSDQA